MALLAEEIVEEWLNRQGYFTIRGIKLGVHEIDILAVKQVDGLTERRHFEVQASMRPISYISHVPKELQRQGRSANSAKRSAEEISIGVREWVDKKFRHPRKLQLLSTLWSGDWTSELVLNVVKSDDEVSLIEAEGIRIHRLGQIIESLGRDKFPIQSASGADFVDLIQMGVSTAD